jgi:hypothetical protein
VGVHKLGEGDVDLVHWKVTGEHAPGGRGDEHTQQ